MIPSVIESVNDVGDVACNFGCDNLSTTIRIFDLARCNQYATSVAIQLFCAG